MSSGEAAALRANPARICWLNFAWSFLLIQAVIVPYFQQNGLTMAQVFLVQTLFSLTLCLLDVPMGYVSDLLGRRTTLLTACVFKGLGGVALACSGSLSGFAGAYVLIGVANSLYSGTDTALMYESHEALPEGRSDANVFGRRVYFAQTGMTAAAILGGLLAQRSLGLAVLLNAIFAWTPLLICLTLTDAPRRPLDRRSHRANAERVLRELFARSRRLRLVVAASVLYGAAPVLALFAFQGYWRAQHLPLAAFGAIAAVYGLTGAFSGLWARRAQSLLGRRGAYLAIGLLPVAGFLGAGLGPVAAGVVFGLCLEVGRGLTQALLGEALNESLSSDIRATANSVVSFGSRLAVAALGPCFGALADARGFPAAFAGLASIYAVVFVVSGLPLALEKAGEDVREPRLASPREALS